MKHTYTFLINPSTKHPLIHNRYKKGNANILKNFENRCTSKNGPLGNIAHVRLTEGGFTNNNNIPYVAVTVYARGIDSDIPCWYISFYKVINNKIIKGETQHFFIFTEFSKIWSGLDPVYNLSNVIRKFINYLNSSSDEFFINNTTFSVEVVRRAFIQFAKEHSKCECEFLCDKKN